MEITINYNGRLVTVEVSIEVAECLGEGRRKEENLHHEQRRHWDDRELDEHIIATEGRLPYCATPEELLCQQETVGEILTVLALCTPTQRERFLLHALYDFSYAEIAEMCGSSKGAVEKWFSSAAGFTFICFALCSLPFWYLILYCLPERI